jgi:glycogen debranching enzyme
VKTRHEVIMEELVTTSFEQIENKNRATEQSPQSSQDSSPLHFAAVLGKSALRSGIQEPYNGVGQLINEGTSAAGIGKVLPEMHLLAAPEPAKFGSSDWFAQTIGSGVGMVAPFMATEFGVGKVLTAEKLTALEARSGMASSMVPLLKPTISGTAYGFIFTPTDTNGNFFEQRGINAVVGGVTFGAQRAATLGVMRGLSATGLPLSEAAFQNSLSGHLTRIGANVIGGSIAGSANAESSSLLSGKGFATTDQLVQSAATFAVTGGALDLAHIAAGKLAGNRPMPDLSVKESAPNEASSETEPPKVGSMDVQSRIEDGTERKANLEIVLKSSAKLSETANQRIDSLFSGTDAQIQKQQFDTLLSDVAAREHIDEVGTDGRHLAKTLEAVNRLLTDDNTDARTSLGLAKQILYETAHINDIQTGNNNTAEAKGVQLLLADRVPGHLADGLVDFALNGTYKTNRSTPVEVDLSPAKLATLPAEYQNTLRPDAEAQRSLDHTLSQNGETPLPGVRSFASQLAQTMLNNIRVQGTDPTAIYVKGEPDASTPNDTGERVLRQNVNGAYEPVTDQGLPKQGANLKTHDIQPIFDHVSGVDNDSLVIKNGNTFMITNTEGRIAGGDTTTRFGIYNSDQRFLSDLDVRLNGVQPKFESASVDQAYAAQFKYSNAEATNLPADTVQLTRDVVINGEKVTEKLNLANASNDSQTVHLTVGYKSDFADMFEVRGWKRTQFGDSNSPIVSPGNSSVLLSHTGLDGQIVHTEIGINAKGNPARITGDGVHFTVTVPPQSQRSVELSIKPGIGEPGETTDLNRSHSEELEQANKGFQEWRKTGAVVSSDNPQFNQIIERAFKDLYMLRIKTAQGDGIGAGIPWYVAPFGRDQLITSLQTLPYTPELAKGVLEQLAAYQGKEENAYTAEKPGKMMHELRTGEMGRNKEIPFTPYYGTVDATPLWLTLLGKYVDQTGDVELARKLQPNVDRVLDYLDKETARNGYLNYGGNGAEALSNQGWKDSGNSISDANGTNVKSPIALAEVQGYLYTAWRQAAKLHELQGQPEKAAALLAKAEDLKVRFNKDFWMPDENFAAMALDGKMNQASSIGSNPGHLLSTGLLTPEHAFAVADRMMQPELYSGYGIRTLSEKMPNYNPGSYHNGTVWPHDNGMIAEGIHDLVPYSGYSQRMLSDFMTVAQKFPGARLPELYGGFSSEENPEPILYPEQSSPQAWAAGTIPQLLSSALAIHPNGPKNELLVFKPALPSVIGNLTVTGYRVNNSTLDLHFSNVDGYTSMTVLSNPDNVKVNYVPNDHQVTT